MPETDARQSVLATLDGATHLLGPLGEPSLRPFASLDATIADYHAIVADWVVVALDLERAAARTIREYEEVQARLFEPDDAGNGGRVTAP